MARRRRIELGASARPCAICGSGDVVVVRSTAAREGFARVNPLWRGKARTYDKCRSCGTKTVVRPRSSSTAAVAPAGRHAPAAPDPAADDPTDDGPTDGDPADDWDDDGDDDADSPRRRTLWLTVPLHLVMLAIVLFDAWAAVTWLGQGGGIGTGLAAVCGLVSLVFLLLLVLDARRHWPRRAPRR